MAGIDSLPPDQRAVVSLVLKQGKSYAEIAGLLGIDEAAVRERAHSALGALAPTEGTPPPPQRRAAVADYLLGQQPAQDADQTRDYLASSASGRAWARVVAGALRPLASNSALPEIPSGGTAAVADAANGSAGSAQTQPARAPTTVAVAEAAPPKQPPPPARPPSEESPPDAGPPRRLRQTAGSSRRAGAVLLGLVAAGLIALVVVLATGGSSKHKAKPASAAKTSTTATPQIVGQINLTPPPGGGHAIGIGLLVAQGNQLALELQAQSLPPTTKSFGYGVWLYNSHTSAEAVGSAPPVGKNGRLSALAALPSDTGNFRALIITRETSSRPTRPGAIVLSGRLPGK
jgi:Sigma-70, region 4